MLGMLNDMLELSAIEVEGGEQKRRELLVKAFDKIIFLRLKQPELCDDSYNWC